jgi:hypothetical protein
VHRGSCPLVRHRLIAVPGAILQRGYNSSTAQAWLWRNCGPTQPKRRAGIIEKDGLERARRCIAAGPGGRSEAGPGCKTFRLCAGWTVVQRRA